MFNVNRFCKALYELDPTLTVGLSIGREPTQEELEQTKISGLSLDPADIERVSIVYTDNASDEDKANCQSLEESWVSSPNPNWSGFYRFLPLEIIRRVCDSRYGEVIISRLSLLTLMDPLDLTSEDLMFTVWNDSPPNIYGDDGDDDRGALWIATAKQYYVPLIIERRTNKLSLEW